MVLEQLDTHVQKDEAGPYFLPRIKTNSKPVKDLNVRAKTVKLLDETQEKNFTTLHLAMISQAWHQKDRQQKNK